MDLEHLNKTQVVLLTLFVSFVTSIATGIVTVSLVNQAPPQVAASVNHIIERTVEQVAAPVAAITPSVKTVIVKDDDITAQSIASVQKSIVRIVASSSPDLLVARGLVIDEKGTVLTDRDAVSEGTSYQAILPDGSFVGISMRAATSTNPLVLGDLSLTASSTPLTAATFADTTKLQLGQTVIRIGGAGLDTVGEGVIARLPQKDMEEIEATVLSTTPGSILTTIFGEVIGITTSESAKNGSDFYSIPSVFASPAPAASH